MHSRILRVFVALTVVLACAATGRAEPRTSKPSLSQSAQDLLAALGTATLDCLGTVGPDRFDTSTGYLARTFDSCPVDRDALARIDAFLGVQHSAEGHRDDLAGQFVQTWNSFVRNFPPGRTRSCPAWRLAGVVDAPTRESVVRLTRLGRPGKQNQRYIVSSDECRSPACAVDRAVLCAGGFGEAFIVDADRQRGVIEVDPAWWLLDIEPEDLDTGCNPFLGSYLHGYCAALGTNPSDPYGAIERAGEQCCYERNGKIFTDGVFIPIDCGGGWHCMSYCTSVPSRPSP